MMSAEEARKISAENLKIKVNEEIATIEREIKLAISNGKNEIDIESSISLEAKNILESNGYYVKKYCEYNEEYTTIKW